MAKPKIEASVQNIVDFVSMTREMDESDLRTLSQRLSVALVNNFGHSGDGNIWRAAVMHVASELQARHVLGATEAGADMAVVWCQRWSYRGVRDGFSLSLDANVSPLPVDEDGAHCLQDGEQYRGAQYQVLVPASVASEVLRFGGVQRFHSDAIPGTDTAPPGWDLPVAP